MLQMFQMAGQSAISRIDLRTFYVGAIGIRSDGVIVRARNEATNFPEPNVHAEARLSQKLDYGAVVFVARMTRVKEGSPVFALSRPCYPCMMRLKSKKVRRVYWTVNETEFEYLDLFE